MKVTDQSPRPCPCLRRCGVYSPRAGDGVCFHAHRFIEIGQWHPRLAGLIAALCDIPDRRRAADFHDDVEGFLLRDQWRVRREYPVVVNHKGGRVDIVAWKWDYVIALELDNRGPRGKSIMKLNALPEKWNKAVLLRNP